jgi:hypothetical protein
MKQHTLENDAGFLKDMLQYARPELAPAINCWVETLREYLDTKNQAPRNPKLATLWRQAASAAQRMRALAKQNGYRMMLARPHNKKRDAALTASAFFSPERQERILVVLRRLDDGEALGAMTDFFALILRSRIRSAI